MTVHQTLVTTTALVLIGSEVSIAIAQQVLLVTGVKVT